MSSPPPTENARLDPRSAVVVTGIGIVSPLGVGRQPFWRALCAGGSGIAARRGADGAPPRLAAGLTDFTPRAHIRSADLRRADTLSRMIVSAGQLALDDAGLAGTALAGTRAGVVVGSALGNVQESVHYLERVFTKGPAHASPMLFPNLVLNAPASYAAMETGWTGANLTVNQGEVSGELAVALGAELIRTQRVDAVLAGGGDQLADIVVAAYRRFRALSGRAGAPEWCSPYDRDRNGVVLGEGAAMLLLESGLSARRRGAPIYAEFVDYTTFGVPAPVYDWPRHAPGAAAQLRRFLGAALGPDAAIDLVCGSANSSRRLDACELEIVTELFRDAAGRVALTSIKGAIGEFGAAGALTVAAACLAVRHHVVPPLCNLRHPAAETAVRFVRGAAAPHRIDRALVLGIARGGATAAVLLQRAG